MLTRRPPEVLALAALLLGAAACLVAAIAFPISDQAPTELNVALAAVTLGLATGTLAVGHRLPGAMLLGEAAVAVLLNSLLVANSHTTGGAMTEAVAYVWLMVYVAIFFPAASGAFAALVAVSFGAGLLASDLPGLITGWVVVTVTVAMHGAVLSRLSRVVRRDLGTDGLTGALNRDGLSRATQRAFVRARRRSEQLTVAAIDLDAFKQVNDREGHAAGDRVLAEAAAAWRGVLRADDVLARTGGDEFVVVMPRTSPEEAEAVLDRLRGAHAVAWSAGIARWEPGESLDACLERADRHLYTQKPAV